MQRHLAGARKDAQVERQRGEHGLAPVVRRKYSQVKRYLKAGDQQNAVYERKVRAYQEPQDVEHRVRSQHARDKGHGTNALRSCLRAAANEQAKNSTICVMIQPSTTQYPGPYV